MKMKTKSKPSRIAIACGGTGGHLFPGLAVAREFMARGHSVLLIFSTKPVDRLFSGQAAGFDQVFLPAVGFSIRSPFSFISHAWSSFRTLRKLFRESSPDAVLGMGGFVTLAPFLAGKLSGARLFLHEANTVPGKAVRYLAPFARRVYVGFEQSLRYFARNKACHTGMPVRWSKRTFDKASAVKDLGLDPASPVLLVIGGSQGASGLNQLIASSIRLVVESCPGIQFIHLTGPHDHASVSQAYLACGARAVVEPFYHDMDRLYCAAELAVSRAGASTIAELRAFDVPGLLIPFPDATDDHQRHNAEAALSLGRFRWVSELDYTPEDLLRALHLWGQSGAVAGPSLNSSDGIPSQIDPASIIVDEILEKIVSNETCLGDSTIREVSQTSIKPMQLSHE